MASTCKTLLHQFATVMELISGELYVFVNWYISEETNIKAKNT
jgi:hypothetical protein